MKLRNERLALIWLLGLFVPNAFFSKKRCWKLRASSPLNTRLAQSVSCPCQLLLFDLYVVMMLVKHVLRHTRSHRARMADHDEHSKRRHVQEEHAAVTRFRHFLRIKTVQPKPDYGLLEL